MKNDDTTNNGGQTPSNQSPVTPKRQTRKERNEANATGKKTQQNKKKSYRRSWRSASPIRRLEIIALGIGAMAGIGYLGVAIWGTLQTKWNFLAEHRPLVIHNRPPQFLQTYKCFPVTHAYQSTGEFAHGDFFVGNIDKTYKNIGNTIAYDVSSFWQDAVVVPVDRTGFSKYGIKITSKDCSIYWGLLGASLEPGVEETIHGRAATGTVPPEVKDGDLVTLEYKICTTYADRDGGKHGTCDLYTLYTQDVANLPSVDKILGTNQLPCDCKERTGAFVPVIGAHCQQ